MPHYVADATLDEGLDYIRDNCDHMTLCELQPDPFASWAENAADTGTNVLATVNMAPSDFSLSNGDVDGRKLVCAAKTGVAVHDNGTATHVAYIDDGNSIVLAYYPLPSSVAVTTSDTVNFAVHDITIRDTRNEGSGTIVHFTNDEGFDNGLDAIDTDVDTIALLNAAPTNVTEANTLITSAGIALATHAYTDVAAPADGDTSGRKITFNEVTGLAVEANGTATHVAYLAVSAGYVAAWYPLTTPRALTTANTFSVPARDLEYRDAQAATT